MGFIIAMVSGALMSIQGVWNTQVTKETGLWVSNMWVQFTAFLFCAIVWVVMGRDEIATLVKVEPRYMLAGGVLGAGITWTVIKSMEALGPAKAVLLIVITQIIIAYGIELLGLFQVEKAAFEWRKVIGIGIALLGLWIFHGSE
ncbi:MAG: DMT family transporter [Eubacteriales bacterium]